MEILESDYANVNVSFSKEKITVILTKEVKKKIIQEIEWKNIRRIFYKSYDYGAPPFLYISQDDKPLNESKKIIVPITDSGGSDLWMEIKRRDLFDKSLAFEAESSGNGLFCWPEI